MISLNIPDELVINHIHYLQKNGLEDRIKKLLAEDIVQAIKNELGQKTADEHRDFVKFILNEIDELKEKNVCELKDNIFVGDFDALNRMIQYVLEEFPSIDTCIREKKQIYVNKNYQEILLEAFGYEEFSQEPLTSFYDREYMFLKKFNKTYLKNLLKEKGGSYSEVISYLLEALDKAHAEGDFLLQEVMLFINMKLKEACDTEYKRRNDFLNDIQDIYGCALNVIKEKMNSTVINVMTYKDYKQRYHTWSAYDFVMGLGVKVCPYCNVNYVSPIYGMNGKARADLDHFYAKHIYPYLSISIYNLVPACKVCNSSLKKGKEFDASNISVYETGLEELYRFTYYPIDFDSFTGNGDIDIEIKYRKSERARKIMHNQQALSIRDIYQYHTNVAKDYIKKSQIYDEAYIEDIYTRYSNLFSSKQEVKECLFEIGTDVKNQSLGKFKTDIAKELGLIDESG